MTLEQRIEALEKAVANLTLPNSKTEELAKMMRDTASEAIKNAQRPGGDLYRVGCAEKAADKETASRISPFETRNGEVFIQDALIGSAIETLQVAKPARDQLA